MSWFSFKITGYTISARSIKRDLSNYCVNIIARDRFYLIPDDPKYIMRMSPAEKYKYGSGESRDCDDAVRIFRGWLSRKKYGNVLAMDVKIYDAKIGYHAVIGFWHQDQLVLAEPQTGAFGVYPNSQIERIIL